MKNKSSSIPLGMLTQKFCCHKCGERLSRHPQIRTVKPGDPDYREHNRLNHRTRMVGEVEVTEYDFQCPSCGNIIKYDEQCVVGKIQKQLRKTILSEAEIADHRDKIKDVMSKKSKVIQAILTAITLVIVALILYSKVKSGDFSFDFYF